MVTLMFLTHSPPSFLVFSPSSPTVDQDAQPQRHVDTILTSLVLALWALSADLSLGFEYQPDLCCCLNVQLYRFSYLFKPIKSLKKRAKSVVLNALQGCYNRPASASAWRSGVLVLPLLSRLFFPCCLNLSVSPRSPSMDPALRWKY